jgi:hypothetical protein
MNQVPDGNALPVAVAGPWRMRDGFRGPHDSCAMSARCKLPVDGSSEPMADHAD